MFQPEVLAENIKNCRIKMGLKQTDLAEKLFVSSQAISKWESGQNIPDTANLCELADIFSTTVDKLLGHSSYAKTEKTFLGIDGGATKTEFVLFTENGNILSHLVSEGCNPNVSGIEKALLVLKSGIDAMLNIPSDISGIFAGISGYTSGDNASYFSAFFKKNYPLIKIQAGSDIINVISSVPYVEKCAAVICGTGFVIFANDGEKLHRIGGWGYLLDSLGGGFGLGKAAICAALFENDGFGKKTLLTKLCEQKLGASVWNSIDLIYKKGDSFIASFAPLVFEAFESGDEVAKEILDTHTEHIKKHLDFALKHYDCEQNVIISGGLVYENDILLNLLADKIPSAKITVPELPQVFGACFKCCSLFGAPSDNFVENFTLSYKQKAV